MMESDDLPAARDMAAHFADVSVPQFWDGELLLGREVSRSLAIEPERPAWDIYLFYPPGAEWTDGGLPPPAKAIAQSRGVVIGSKGTLPPKGDQSRLAEWYQGRADVVGEPAELAELLTAIAVPFVEVGRPRPGLSGDR
jgi:hypothetical protein